MEINNQLGQWRTVIVDNRYSGWDKQVRNSITRVGYNVLLEDFVKVSTDEVNTVESTYIVRALDLRTLLVLDRDLSPTSVVTLWVHQAHEECFVHLVITYCCGCVTSCIAEGIT